MKNFRTIAILLALPFLLLSCLSITNPNDENIDDENTDEPNTEEIFYYRRSTLEGDMLLAYDFILDKLWDWEDAKIEVTDAQKNISFNGTGIKINKEELNIVVSYIRDDVHELYMLISRVRDVKFDSSGNVEDFLYCYPKIPSYQQYKRDISEINIEANKILSKIKSDMTDVQKIKILHDELLKLVSYGGMLYASASSIDGAFIDKKVICDGYARSFSYLLQKAGLKSIYIIGEPEDDGSGGLHARNKVQVGGKWYNVDPTWDDDISPGGSGVFYRYFLIGDKNFSKTHAKPYDDKYSKYYPPLPIGANEDYPRL